MSEYLYILNLNEIWVLILAESDLILSNFYRVKLSIKPYHSAHYLVSNTIHHEAHYPILQHHPAIIIYPH